MRAERRQELRSNELADALVRLKEFYESHSTYVWGGILAIALVLVASSLWYRTSVGRRENEWNQFYSLVGDVETQVANSGAEGAPEGPITALKDLESLADSASSPTVRNWASLTVADVEWFRANSSELSGGDLARAKAAFEEIVNSPQSDPVMKMVALMGLGAVAENNAKFDRAKALYQQVVDDMDARHTGIVPLAEASIARLDRPQVTGKFPPKPEVPEEEADTANASAAAKTPATEKANPNVVQIKQGPAGTRDADSRFTESLGGDNAAKTAPAGTQNNTGDSTFTSQSTPKVPTTQPVGDSPE